MTSVKWQQKAEIGNGHFLGSYVCPIAQALWAHLNKNGDFLILMRVVIILMHNFTASTTPTNNQLIDVVTMFVGVCAKFRFYNSIANFGLGSYCCCGGSLHSLQSYLDQIRSGLLRWLQSLVSIISQWLNPLNSRPSNILQNKHRVNYSSGFVLSLSLSLLFIWCAQHYCCEVWCIESYWGFGTMHPTEPNLDHLQSSEIVHFCLEIRKKYWKLKDLYVCWITSYLNNKIIQIDKCMQYMIQCLTTGK
jgi:hypothetical protein